MVQIKTFILTLLVLFTTMPCFAQDQQDEVKDLSNGSLEEQFDYVISKSNKFSKYHVVTKKVWLNQLKSHSLDSLEVIRKELKTVQEVNGEQEKEIVSLKEELVNTNNDLSAINIEKDQISLFGISMKKGVYKSIMWAIIIGLAILLFIFVGRFARGKSVAAQALKSHNEVVEEFNNYKNKAMENEQKLRRKLQDEINRHL